MESEGDTPLQGGPEGGFSDNIQDFNFSATSLDEEMDDIDHLNSE